MKIRIGGYRTYNNVFLIMSVFLYLTYVYLPAVPANLPGIIRYMFLLMIFLCFCLGFLMIDKKAVPEMTGRVILSFGLSMLLYLGKWSETDFISYIINAMMFWLPFLMAESVRKLNDEWKKKIFKFYLVLTGGTLLTTIIGNKSNTIASRILAGGMDGSSGLDSLEYSKMNIGGYGFVYSLVLLLPYLFYALKIKKERYFTVFLIVVSTYAVFYTQYTLAVVAILFVYLAIIIFAEKKSQMRTVYAFETIAAVILLKDVIFNILYKVQEVLAGKGFHFLADRLLMVLKMFTVNTLQGDVQVRRRLYMMSWDAFLENPFLGNIQEMNVIGGHSEILDILGAAGLVGILIFIWIMRKHTKTNNKMKGTILYKYYRLSFYIFLFVAFFNTVMTSPPMAVPLFLVPILLEETRVCVSQN